MNNKKHIQDQTMKMFIRIALFLFFISGIAHAMDITTLLKAVKDQPEVKFEELSVAKSKKAVKKGYAPLFPKIYAVGSYENYNSPTNFRPLPPTEVNIAAGESIPFSDEIFRYGVKASMPIFAKEIFDTAKQLKTLTQKSEIRKKITLIQNESIVVSLNSTLEYLKQTKHFIKERIASLEETRKILDIGVKNGRIPESEVFKIDKTIKSLYLQLSDISTKEIDVIRDIYSVTGIQIEGPVLMTLVVTPLAHGDYIALSLARKDVDSAEQAVKIKKDYLYPKLFLNGFYTKNYGDAYNTGESIDRDYGAISVNVSFPLFDRTPYMDEEIAKIDLKKAKENYRKTKKDLDAKAKSLEQRRPVIEDAIGQAKKNIELSEEILNISKVSFKNKRMTIEDYLKYEIDLLQAKADLSLWESKKWSLVAEQAVLYGQNLLGVVQ
jgi:outer membrane protein TolC